MKLGIDATRRIGHIEFNETTTQGTDKMAFFVVVAILIGAMALGAFALEYEQRPARKRRNRK